MDGSGDDFDSDQEPDYLSEEEEMEFLDQQPKASAVSKARSSVWGVIDKSVLAHVQVTLRVVQHLLLHVQVICCQECADRAYCAGRVVSCSTKHSWLLTRHSQKALDSLSMGQRSIIW